MPDITLTRKDLTDWDEHYTIEFNGTKGWEIVWFQPREYGLHKASWQFQTMAVNRDGQYRLTTPKT